MNLLCCCCNVVGHCGYCELREVRCGSSCAAVKAVFVVVYLGSIKGAMAADAVDVPVLVSGLTKERFRRLKKDQLITLAEEEEVELEKDMTKPAIAACLIKVLGLEEMWSEQDREKDIELQR